MERRHDVENPSMRQRDAISLKRILILARQRFAPRQFFSIEIQFSHGARPIFCRSGIFLASGGIGFHRRYRSVCPFTNAAYLSEFFEYLEIKEKKRTPSRGEESFSQGAYCREM